MTPRMCPYQYDEFAQCTVESTTSVLLLPFLVCNLHQEPGLSHVMRPASDCEPWPSAVCLLHAAHAAQAMLSSCPYVSAVSPPDLLDEQIGLLGPVVVDSVPPGSAFGDVVVQPLPAYWPGQAAEAVFR